MASSPKPYVYNPNPPKLPLYKYVIAGGGAGVCEIMLMYPLDVVKTRMQLQVSTKGAEVLYKSTLGTLMHIIKNDGPLTLYKGIASPILAEAPKRAWKFASNEKFKQLYTGVLPQFIVASAAGTSAGLTETMVNAPFEVVKVRMQARGSPFTSTANAVTTILRTEGVSALYRGGSAQAARNGVWNGVFFGIISELKAAFPEPTSEAEELMRNMAAGTIGGTIATCCNTPFDVVKSRMQNTPLGQPMPGIFATLRNIHATEGGFRALYKGLGPRLLRLGPGGGVMAMAFAWISKNLP